MFPLFRIRAALRYWVEAYCVADYTRCRRYTAMMTGDPPPATMLPNGKMVQLVPAPTGTD